MREEKEVEIGTRSVATIVESIAVRTTPIQMLPIIRASLASDGSSIKNLCFVEVPSSMRFRALSGSVSLIWFPSSGLCSVVGACDIIRK